MKKKKKISGGFAMQATILAVASVVSKLIGMLYNIPFANILSKEGNGYYGAAQTVYALILLIATFSIPAAVSKIMAEKIEKGEYRNVKRIFNGAMLYVFVVGGIAAVVTYLFAPHFVTENAVLSLRLLAPTIFLSGFLSVYRGYFQAYGNMVPTSVSQIVEQIFNAIFSIAAALAFMQWAKTVGNGTDAAKYGAAGGTLGTGVAVLAGLFYMIFLFHGEKRELRQKMKADTTNALLSYQEVIKLLLMIATPIIFSSFIYNVNVTLDMTIFQKMAASMGMSGEIIDGQYGLYSRMYLVLANVPIAMAAAVASAVIPGVSSAYASGSRQECNRRISQSMQLTMVLTVPCAVGFAVLGRPIVRLLYYSLSGEDTHIVAAMLLFGGISIILYGISSVLNGVLQGIGKVNIPVISAATALVVHVLLLVPLIGIAKIGIYSLIFATAFYAVIVVAMNYYFVKKELRFKMEWKQTIWVPAASAVVMGVVAVFVYQVFYRVFHMAAGERLSNAVAVLAAIVSAVFVYFAAMIKIGGYTKEMLSAFPKGALLVKLAEKMKLLGDCGT
ncbi:MAG: polysaccharide biosynthesis protein [Bacteroidales bacterium]|nr:polysaccharide biosynthesis protein [Clostridium sp.]MCM1204071.1 polysaccharide biosynthesis protein [Bacteroidales bacterium]